MGASRADYERAVPKNSFIHVDDFDSIRDLALYLRVLSTNTTLYNSYFKWKSAFSYLNTKFYCRLCAMLHDNTHPPTWYKNINQWWNGRDICVRMTENNPYASWRHLSKIRI